jgi:AcrR family transcriptional regulator
MDAKTQKSELTLSAIIDAALDIATRSGLFSVTLQGVADKLFLSKSGIFSRVGSKESLQMAVVDEYGKRFLAAVFLPAMLVPKGSQRLDAIVQAWMNRVCSARSMGHCLLETTAFSFELEQQGALQQHLVQAVAAWRGVMSRTIKQCIETGSMHPDTDADSFLFELHSIMLGVLYDAQFMGEQKAWQRGRQCYARLLSRHQTNPGLPLQARSEVLSQ